MDWQTIFTAVVASLLSSSLITAGIIYLVKKGIDRAIDLRYEKLLEEMKLQTQENARRKAALYDQQSKVLQELVAQVHRLRRLARDLSLLYGSQKPNEKKSREWKEAYQELESRFSAFREFISNNRTLLTDEYLAAQHDIGGLVSNVKAYHQLFDRQMDKTKADEFLGAIQEALVRLDDEYLRLLNQAQIRLGILEDKRQD